MTNVTLKPKSYIWSGQMKKGDAAMLEKLEKVCGTGKKIKVNGVVVKIIAIEYDVVRFGHSLWGIQAEGV